MKVVIIGAGVAGLSIGWRLAQAGQEVTVLERAQPGGGASWAAAGMLAAGCSEISRGATGADAGGLTAGWGGCEVFAGSDVLMGGYLHVRDRRSRTRAMMLIARIVTVISSAAAHARCCQSS